MLARVSHFRHARINALSIGLALFLHFLVLLFLAKEKLQQHRPQRNYPATIWLDTPKKLALPSSPLTQIQKNESPLPKQQSADLALEKKKPLQATPVQPAPQKTIPAKTKEQFATKNPQASGLVQKNKKTENINRAREKQLARLRELLTASTASTFSPEALESYTAKIQEHIRSYIFFNSSTKNFLTVVYVELSPVGEVLHTKLIKSSGNARWDDAVTTAIYSASPLPTDPGAPLNLKITFHSQN